MLTKKLLMYVAALIRQPGESFASVSVAGPVSGGSIHQAYKLKASSGDYFIKCSEAGNYPGIFMTESSGLEALRKTNTVKIPYIIAIGEVDGVAYLLMDYLEAGKRSSNYFKQLGVDLAMLHRNQNDSFGWNEDNYIGSLPQQNNFMLNGIDFLIELRYKSLVEMALKNKIISHKEAKLFDDLYRRLSNLVPDEPASLLHGDLWNGNVITGPDGKAWLIDPAVYYGHRETDIAMTKLFGGFDDDFYDSYNETFPLQPDWENRIQLFQLYPLLVHLILFGRSYWSAIEATLKK